MHWDGLKNVKTTSYRSLSSCRLKGMRQFEGDSLSRSWSQSWYSSKSFDSTVLPLGWVDGSICAMLNTKIFRKCRARMGAVVLGAASIFSRNGVRPAQLRHTCSMGGLCGSKCEHAEDLHFYLGRQCQLVFCQRSCAWSIWLVLSTFSLIADQRLVLSMLLNVPQSCGGMVGHYAERLLFPKQNLQKSVSFWKSMKIGGRPVILSEPVKSIRTWVCGVLSRSMHFCNTN